MRSAMSDFIETDNFNKFSLDLNLGERASLCNFFFRLPSAILDPSSSQDFRLISSNPKIFWTGEQYGLQGGQHRTMFHITRVPSDMRRNNIFCVCNNNNYDKRWGGFDLPFVSTLPAHPAPPGHFRVIEKIKLDVAPNRRSWSMSMFTLN